MRKIFFTIAVLLFVFVCRLEAAPRIISLAPNITEILFRLGMGNSIVGLDDFSNYPKEANNIEKIGAFNSPDMEKIILLKPDYILISSGLGFAREEYFNNIGIKIIKIAPRTMKELYGDISRLGVIFNKEQAAEDILRDMRIRIENIFRKKNIEYRPKIFVQLFNDPLITVSSFVNDIIELAGGENVASDIKNDSGIFSYEVLMERNPDIILEMGFSNKSDFPASINAVRNHRVYRNMDSDLVLRPGPRSAEAVEALNRIFYE